MDDDSDVPPETQIFCLVAGRALWSSSDAENVSRAPPRRAAAEGAARALMALRPLVERVLRRARVPERDVPDVFQNVLLAVWPWWAERSAAPSSPAHDTRPAYVVVVARRMAMQHHRRWCHRGEVLEWDDRDDRHAPTPTHAPSPPSPEDSLIAAEAEAERATEADLEVLSEATPPARWRAFYAYAVEELPVARIAASEHAPRATIYTRIRLAREDLRAALVRLRAARRRR